MTDYERHASLLAGPRADMYEIASVLGSHGFRITTTPQGMIHLFDAVTLESIAITHPARLGELAAWLERERPLPARAPTSILAELGIVLDDAAAERVLRTERAIASVAKAAAWSLGYTPEERGT